MTENEYTNLSDLHRGWIKQAINHGDKEKAATIFEGVIGARRQYNGIPAAYIQNHADINTLAVELYKGDSEIWKLAEHLQHLGLKLQVVDA